jgi:hypothetical protein
MKPIEEEFRHFGIVRGHSLKLRPADAIALVRACQDRGIEVLGLEAFRLTETTTQPDMDESIDLVEDWKLRPQCWDRAEAFLTQRLASDMYFEVNVGDQQ